MEIAGDGERLGSQNLLDFLRIKEEDHHNNLHHSTSGNSGGGQNNHSGLTLNAILSEKRGPAPPADELLQRVQSNRTLLDIIREDQTSGFRGSHRDGKRSWRQLRDKIRLRRRGSGSAWASTVPVPASDIPINNNNRMMMMTLRSSTRFTSGLDSGESTQPDISAVPDVRSPSLHRNSSRAIERASGRFEHTNSLPMRRLLREDNDDDHEEEVEQRSGDTVEEEEAAEGEGELEQPVRMSLMALLAETDRQMGLEGSAYLMDEEDEAEEEESSSGAALNGGEYNNCCVCMVRHKGSAFIPCGHTFCRLCSRELWVQRGNCPLCNNYILEILDIF